MFHLRLGELWSGKGNISHLNNEAEANIGTRGNSLSALLPAELDDSAWYLAISDIAYSYCLTNRYLYYKKVERKKPALTLASFKGRTIDEFIQEIYQKTYDYSVGINLRNFSLFDDVCKTLNTRVDELEGTFDYAKFSVPPIKRDVDKFFENLKKLVYHEILCASSLMSYRVSNLYDINLKTEMRILFPFDFKLKIAAPTLGVSGSAEIDFLIRQSVIGEIKSEQWHKFYNVGLAGYALAYEADRLENVNLGVVVCPIFYNNRQIPIYENRTNIQVITEAWRLMFIRNRNKRMELVRDQEDPGVPPDNSLCTGCGYYGECWP